MRTDLTSNLIHFTKGSSLEEAYLNLSRILEGKMVIASNNKIKGGTPCVCFTETPLRHLNKGFFAPSNKKIYQNFGIMVKKEDVFKLGGRPVIYQPDEEYALLSPSLQWRHVRFEPPVFDFSWEREWRLPNNFVFDYEDVSIIVPDSIWKTKLENDFSSMRERKIFEYSQIMEETLARQLVVDQQCPIYPLISKQN